MRNSIVFFLFLISTYCFGESKAPSLKDLDITASEYRMMSIECVADLKITSSNKDNIKSCERFFNFVRNDYENLKSSLENQEIMVKEQGRVEGLDSDGLRSKLVLIMSVRSHMRIAGMVSREIGS